MIGPGSDKNKRKKNYSIKKFIHFIQIKQYDDVVNDPVAEGLHVMNINQYSDWDGE